MWFRSHRSICYSKVLSGTGGLELTLSLRQEARPEEYEMPQVPGQCMTSSFLNTMHTRVPSHEQGLGMKPHLKILERFRIA